MSASGKTVAYIGAYTSGGGKGITVCDYDAESGKLTPTGVSELKNPSYVIVSHDRNYAYAVIEAADYQGLESGGVAAFRIDPSTGALRFINACPTLGRDPCYLSVDKGNTRLAVANYSDGSIACFTLSPDGAVNPPAQLTKHEGSGTNAKRQEKAHAHFVGFTSDEGLLYAVDLGIDAVKFYRPIRDGGRFTLSADGTAFAFQPGSGPRHLVFGRNGMVYAVTELTSQVCVFRLREGETVEPLQTLSLLPEGYACESYASAVRISSDGRFLYAGNRGHDSVSVFQIGGDGLLEKAGCYPTGGEYPRDINFSPDGKYLFATNQNSDTVASFEVDKTTGGLHRTENTLSLPMPVCICFAELKPATF